MFTHKLWLLALPVAALALQGCGGGSNGVGPSKTQPGDLTLAMTPAPPAALPLMGDNIGRFSNVTPTNGESNVNTTDLTSDPRNTVFSGSEFAAQIEVGTRVGTNNTNFRPFYFTFDDANLVAGRSYRFGPEDPNSNPLVANASYSQFSSFNPTDGEIDGQSWQAESGTLIVDSFTRASDGAIEAINFRVVNARFVPRPSRNTDPRNQAQGAFTFDYTGNANNDFFIFAR